MISNRGNAREFTETERFSQTRDREGAMARRNREVQTTVESYFASPSRHRAFAVSWYFSLANTAQFEELDFSAAASPGPGSRSRHANIPRRVESCPGGTPIGIGGDAGFKLHNQLADVRIGVDQILFGGGCIRIRGQGILFELRECGPRCRGALCRGHHFFVSLAAAPRGFDLFLGLHHFKLFPLVLH